MSNFKKSINNESINKSAEYLSSKIVAIPSGNKLVESLNETLLTSSKTVEEVGKLEDEFNALSNSELELIQKNLDELELTYKEIDSIETIINSVIEKVNKVDEALSKEELTIRNLQDPLFSSLPFIKK